eukprot:365286-Chlamydomonas_euryale.AAC.4
MGSQSTRCGRAYGAKSARAPRHMYACKARGRTRVEVRVWGAGGSPGGGAVEVLDLLNRTLFQDCDIATLDSFQCVQQSRCNSDSSRVWGASEVKTYALGLGVGLRLRLWLRVGCAAREGCGAAREGCSVLFGLGPQPCRRHAGAPHLPPNVPRTAAAEARRTPAHTRATTGAPPEPLPNAAKRDSSADPVLRLQALAEAGVRVHGDWRRAPSALALVAAARRTGKGEARGQASRQTGGQPGRQVARSSARQACVRAAAAEAVSLEQDHHARRHRQLHEPRWRACTGGDRRGRGGRGWPARSHGPFPG